ncbi:glycosyltransferase family 2 protein [Micromonospora sp. DT227]|uniref:glycosyltransferase family 2 protein n=1 Tax=Micromonospora sp. DT227 TaxID=3393433 RepID=UPI003CE6D363
MDASVVVPVHNRATAALNVLHSLRHQSVAAASFEVIMVDDGSSIPLVESLGAALPALRTALDLRIVRHDTPRGVQAARNAGAELATGDVLVFLDVDCIAHPDLLRGHIDAQAGRPVAVCGYTSARELTPDTWRLLLGPNWDFGDSLATFARADRSPYLHDTLTELLAEPSPSDWAFFWTHNVSLPRWAFTHVGGFSQTFPYKGVEDIEYGYRLARAGLPTIFAPGARAIHQPHERRRGHDITFDRHNEHILVRRYPTVEVEAVCSYDIVNSRHLVPVLEDFARRVPVESADAARLDALPELARRLGAAESVLLLGSPAGWPVHLRRPTEVCFPGTADESATRLIGTRLPYLTGQFELGLVTDYWRHFPERTASRVLSELQRVCRDVLVLSGVSSAPVAAPDPRLAEALSRYDHPFWEFTVRLRRELHEFRLVEQETARCGAAVFSLTETAWPVTELASTAVDTPIGRD